MTDLLSALKDQVRSWIVTTGRLLKQPRHFVRAPANEQIPEPVVPNFNPYYFLAVGLFVAFQFIYSIITSIEAAGTDGTSTDVTRAANNVIGLLHNASFIQLVLPLILPFLFILLIYALVAKLVYWHHEAPRDTLQHAFLYYGALGLLALPLLLFLSNLTVNVLMGVDVPLLDAGPQKWSLLDVVLVGTMLINVTLIGIVLWHVHKKDPEAGRDAPKVPWVLGVAYAVLIPMPQLVVGYFVNRYGEYAAKQDKPVSERTLYAQPTDAAGAAAGSYLMGFEPDPANNSTTGSPGNRFVSGRVYCINTGRLPLLLERNSRAAYGIYHFLEEDNATTANDHDGNSSADRIPFEISSWQAGVDADQLVLNPGENAWLRLTYDQNRIPEETRKKLLEVDVKIVFKVLGVRRGEKTVLEFSVPIQ